VLNLVAGGYSQLHVYCKHAYSCQTRVLHEPEQLTTAWVDDHSKLHEAL